MKLELGAGRRPTPGYVTNDLNPFPGVDHVCHPWEINLPPDSVAEVLALGVIEHLTYGQARRTFYHMHHILQPGGVFLFDVPDIEVWCGYLVNGTDLFTREHVLATLHGWQRWPGDEHKSGWTADMIADALDPLFTVEYGKDHFLGRGHYRQRMSRPGDAHIYVQATK